MHAIEKHFTRLNKKEQLLVIGCGVLLLLYLLYYLLWSPISSQHEGLQTQRQQAHLQLREVTLLAQKYRELIKTGTGESAPKQINLSKVADSSATAHQLQIKRYQPSALGGAQVRFENVAFGGLVGWLHEMEAVHKVSIQDISITGASDSGLVNVSVRLGKP